MYQSSKSFVLFVLHVPRNLDEPWRRSVFLIVLSYISFSSGCFHERSLHSKQAGHKGTQTFGSTTAEQIIKRNQVSMEISDVYTRVFVLHYNCQKRSGHPAYSACNILIGEKSYGLCQICWGCHVTVNMFTQCLSLCVALQLKDGNKRWAAEGEVIDAEGWLSSSYLIPLNTMGT